MVMLSELIVKYGLSGDCSIERPPDGKSTGLPSPLIMAPSSSFATATTPEREIEEEGSNFSSFSLEMRPFRSFGS